MTLAPATSSSCGSGLDRGVGHVWMYVSETDGQLTRFFEDSVFPEGVHPAAGPATGWPPGPLWPESNQARHGTPTRCTSPWPTASRKEGLQFKPAVGAAVWAQEGKNGLREWRVVPEEPDGHELHIPGVVAFRCARSSSSTVYGGAVVPHTDLVSGHKTIASWQTDERHCGQLVFVEVKAHKYLPWRLLNLAADTLTGHFGYTRGRIVWNLRFDGGLSYYNPIPLFEKIVLAWLTADEGFFFTVGHEYGHALHHKALGGLWWPGDKAWDYWDWTCFSHWLTKVTNVRCACRRASPTTPGPSGRVATGGTASSTSETPGSP